MSRLATGAEDESKPLSAPYQSEVRLAPDFSTISRRARAISLVCPLVSGAIKIAHVRSYEIGVAGRGGDQYITAPCVVRDVLRRGPDRWDARLPFRWPQRETGKISAFIIPVTSG